MSNSQQLHRPDQHDCQNVRWSSQTPSTVQSLITLMPYLGAEHSASPSAASQASVRHYQTNSRAAAGGPTAAAKFSKYVLQ